MIEIGKMNSILSKWEDSNFLNITVTRQAFISKYSNFDLLISEYSSDYDIIDLNVQHHNFHYRLHLLQCCMLNKDPSLFIVNFINLLKHFHHNLTTSPNLIPVIHNDVLVQEETQRKKVVYDVYRYPWSEADPGSHEFFS